MPPIKYSSINELEDNNNDVYMGCIEVLIKIAGNLLKEPDNPKYRSISLGSNSVVNNLLPASGAMQCLFDMGFEEDSDRLILPVKSPLDCVKYIHDELIKRRDLRKKLLLKSAKQETENHKFDLIKKDIQNLMKFVNNNFLKEFSHNILEIQRCESISLQLKALKCIPLIDLKRNVEKTIRQMQISVENKEIDEQEIDFNEILLFELCKWFKTKFFQWVNTPACLTCGNKETQFVEKIKSQEDGITVTEVYNCIICNESVLFPRYNSAEKLLETRCGRCGEWAKCFYLLCRSLGWDVRFVVDATDHVWIEFYSLLKKKWIHCDPCETVIDSPLIYECGWGKDLSYIIAYSKDEIQDVTWRYSCNHSKIMKNRKLCSENELIDLIYNIRTILLNYASSERKKFVIKRTALELVELLVEKTVTQAEKQGRVSGSLAWRLARGEVSLPEKFEPHIWRPEEIDKKNMKFILSYCTSSDEYILDCSQKIVKGWETGLYEMSSVFRKEEYDWKTAYLARQKGSDVGTLVWRFEVNGNYTFGDIQLKLISQTFENGKVLCKIFNDNVSVPVSGDKTVFSTSKFNGSKWFELKVELSGGRGEDAWQHAQLLRQVFSEYEKTFQIIVYLIKIPD